MQQAHEAPSTSIDKGAVDATLPDSLTVSAGRFSRVDSRAFGEAFELLLQDLRNRFPLGLRPLRLITSTPDLGSETVRWQRALGLPESGVSQQPEGTAVAKTMSWGKDAASARSIILVSDGIAAGLISKSNIAPPVLVHELVHVHDYFLRGVVLGFRESETPPSTKDWPAIRAYLAEIIWSESVAESVAALYTTQENMDHFLANDCLHLAGTYARLRQAVWSYRCGQCSLDSLWQNCITDLGDILANLGRAIGRITLLANCEDELCRLTKSDSDVTCWKPVVERLKRELEALGAKPYSKWTSASLDGIQEAVSLGFQVVGLFPAYDRGSVVVKVR